LAGQTPYERLLARARAGTSPRPDNLQRLEGFDLPPDRPPGMPARRIGRHWRLKTSEVHEWVRAGCADSDRTRTKK
jgi:hypothetical protein